MSLHEPTSPYLLPYMPVAVLMNFICNICAIVMVARHRSVHRSPRCVLPRVALPSPIGSIYIEKVGLRWGDCLDPGAAYGDSQKLLDESYIPVYVFSLGLIMLAVCFDYAVKPSINNTCKVQLRNELSQEVLRDV